MYGFCLCYVGESLWIEMQLFLCLNPLKVRSSVHRSPLEVEHQSKKHAKGMGTLEKFLWIAILQGKGDNPT